MCETKWNPSTNIQVYILNHAVTTTYSLCQICQNTIHAIVFLQYEVNKEKEPISIIEKKQ